MQFLTTEETEEWCRKRRFHVTSDHYLRYDTGAVHCFTIGLEDKAASRIIALADHLVPTWEETPFSGALLWLNNFGIWGDYSEQTGSMILQQMRRASDETSTLTTRPGHVFGAAELFEMHAFFVVPLLFGWDAYLVPEGQDYFLYVSHDGVVGVVSRTPQTGDELKYRVRHWDPKPDSAWYEYLVRE